MNEPIEKTDDIAMNPCAQAFAENDRLRRELAVERARARTQAALAEELDTLPEATAQALRAVTVHRRIAENLFAILGVVVLACPDCGTVWVAAPGEAKRSGYRLCARCMGTGSDPWK